MKNWTYFIISLIACMLIGIAIPSVTSADEDLDALHETFQRTHHKDGKNNVHLAKKQYDQATINQRQILVKISPDTTLTPEDFGVRLVDEYDFLEENHIRVVQVPEDSDYSHKLTELSRADHVIHAEPDYLLTDMSDGHVQQDSFHTKQWYLDKINLPQAWEVTRGSNDVTIAVIDSGINGNHPDLSNRVLDGFDFLNNTEAGKNSDDLGHGTHVAGIIGADTNPTAGMTGIIQEASLLPIKAMGSEGTGTTSEEIDSIYYAIDQDVDVINMSYVTESENLLEEEALWQAHDAGIVLVSAAGNYATEEPMYPGSYPQVINVASTTKDDQLAHFSNFGMGIDIAAPGEDIYSTALDGGYFSDDGTSFSAPIVSGIAGLLKSAHPEWTSNEIRYALEHSADVLEGLEWDHHFGYGRANAYRSMNSQPPEQKDEAGHDSETAISVESGKKVTGQMELPLDVGWYTFSVSETSDVTVDLINESPHADLVGVLYQEKHGDFEEIEVLDDTTMGGDEQLIQKLDPDEYYLAVSEYHGRWSEDSYDVKVNYEDVAEEKRPYSDVSIYQKEIEYLRDAGIIHGFPNGEFKPDQDVTRMQALEIILREKGIDVDQYEAPNPHFKDIKHDDEEYQSVATAVDLGIINGKEDHTFDPWGSLSRAQMAAIMARTYDYTGVSEVDFTDVMPSHWSYNSIQALVVNDIVKGYPDRTFKPDAPLSRQHFSLMMYQHLTTE